jgi:2,3,4,5-tetrahydropyridine-2-carboxylate N-succinyltransferase
MSNNWESTVQKLETGEIRAAEKIDGIWVANKEVKSSILEVFKAGDLKEMSSENYPGFVDKHTLPPRSFSVEDKIRLVPGGSSVRSGAYVAPGVIIMAPAYVNIGAYIDSGTMVDSNVLVGSCAQIGKNVHLSAGVQIGGVLEPIGLTPVVIEDDAFIGAGSSIVEGVVVREKAVIAPGVVLSKGTLVYDCVNEKIFNAIEGIPSNAVVVPGSRPVNDKLPWAKELGINLNCAVIVKYRDGKTDDALELESFIR